MMIEKQSFNSGYIPFNVEDYVSNPIALARIEKNLTQNELAVALGVSQAYISKLEGQDKVSAKMLLKVKTVLKKM